MQPADYEHCLDNYNNEEFEKLKLVPTRLKERVYENGEPTIKEILKSTLTRKTHTLSDLPSGYRQYISKHPDKFRDYFEQKRHELGLLKSVVKNLSTDDKRRLQAYYDEHKTIEPEKFSDIIASFKDDRGSSSSSSSSSSSTKRPRPTVGGVYNPFDLESKMDD